VAEMTHTFDDGAAYERFMGRWSRAAGAIFLDWITPPKDARWLDVGCGTGVFTELVLDRCSPATVIAVDPSAAQIELAHGKPVAQRADFRVADAQTLPFPAGAFDVVASALVINFIPDPARALAEMRRVARPGGVLAGYVWDFAGSRSPGSLLRRAMLRIGADDPPVSGTETSRLDAIRQLFAQAGLQEIASRTIDVTVSFPDFDDFWQSQIQRSNPTSKMIAALPESDRAKLIVTARAELQAAPDGTFAYSARANAIKARVPD
jgi:ubiquinone/menaquinone biosynthesis C-methylase UbiE